MVSLIKLSDSVLIVFFILFAVAAPFDAGLCLSPSLLPDFLLRRLKPLYAQKYGDYLATHKPAFFVALVWLELVFLWPLQLLILYAILVKKPWLNISTLVFGASYSTTMYAVLAELKSHTVSDKLVMVYLLLIGCGVLSLLRGLLPYSSTTTINTRPDESSGTGKKRA